MTASLTARRPAPSRIGRRRVILVAAAAGVVLTGCTGQAPASHVATAPVERASIATLAGATGTLAASQSANLGFMSGGQLTTLAVRVGDHVRAGQLLATVDAGTLKDQVAQQKANLAQQQAVLDRLSHSPAASGAASTLTHAQQILSATQGQVNAASRADDVAINRANAQLSSTQDVVDTAQNALDAARASCATPPCAAVATAQAALATAKQGLETARTGVATAEQKKQVDAASGQVTVASAQQGVVAAQNGANTAASDRTYTIAQQRAAVDAARTLVDVAERNLTHATLIAPFDGTVSAINGTVGEYLAPSTGITALAPGSDAGIPGTNLNANASAVSRPGGTQFIVLSGTGPMLAVVPFSEADAALITAGQAASVTLDALPELNLSGTVVAVSPAGTALSGAMSYYVTVRIESGDPRLKEGLTAHAAVPLSEKKDVLTVPNAAVHVQDGKSLVTVLDAAGQQKTSTFTPGLVGADRTEVVSGLTEGDRVVVPSMGA